MINEIIRAFMLIFIAEMGDKTQILALAFATRFPVKKVILGIGLGSFLNHGIAVLLGSYLSTLIPINMIQIVAGFAFMGFSLWTLKPDEEQDDSSPKIEFSPIKTVALAFFLGELGDKTQLTAITLASEATYPIMILIGTVMGMIFTGALGIYVGKKIGNKIPEIGIKIIASTIFMFFGVQKLFQTLPGKYLQPIFIIPAFAILLIVIAKMVRRLFYLRKEGFNTNLSSKLNRLHEYHKHLEKDLSKICLGEDFCEVCKGDKCAIGNVKKLVRKAKHDKDDLDLDKTIEIIQTNKPFDKQKVYDSLIDTLILIESCNDDKELQYANTIRRQFEKILFDKHIKEFTSITKYFLNLKEVNKDGALKLKGLYNMRKPINDRIINLGNRISNIYLVEIEEGYMLIDTGYKEHYELLSKNLRNIYIDKKEIKYIFLTHAHDDHAGFLNQMLEDTDAKVILHSEATKRLKIGQNSFEGGCSSFRAWLFCKFMKLFGKGDHLFEPVDKEERYIELKSSEISKLEKKLNARIIRLPGHTKDSIGIIFDDEILFSGDATMNGFPSTNRVIIWIENLKEYKKSWEKMIEEDFNIVYPSHGTAFPKEELIENKDKLEDIKLYPLE